LWRLAVRPMKEVHWNFWEGTKLTTPLFVSLTSALSTALVTCATRPTPLRNTSRNTSPTAAIGAAVGVVVVVVVAPALIPVAVSTWGTVHDNDNETRRLVLLSPKHVFLGFEEILRGRFRCVSGSNRQTSSRLRARGVARSTEFHVRRARGTRADDADGVSVEPGTHVSDCLLIQLWRPGVVAGARKLIDLPARTGLGFIRFSRDVFRGPPRARRMHDSLPFERA